MADNKKIKDVLQNLIETCRDGQRGFREAAEHLKDVTIREFFNEQSIQRAQFAGELEAEIHRFGERDVDTSGSVAAAMHRAWIDLKSALGGSDEAILAAAETGEDNAKHAYEDALQENLPENILQIVRRQADSVFRAHDQVRMWRDRKAA
jgi:uncharacterized protein (TIGR02284 family)